jgi:predicted O-linked N-acetylglucosamine transferase (SPINDLY family)
MPHPLKIPIQKSSVHSETAVPSPQSDLAELFNQGLVLHQEGQLAQAKQIYTQVLAKQPDYYDALHLAGVIALQSNDPMLALELIGKAIETKPDYAEAWSNYGYAFNDLKRYKEALASYDRAIEIKPDYAEAWSNRGNALNNLNHYEEALVSYDRAIEIKPDYVQAWSNRGNVLTDLKRYEQALGSYDRAIEIKPNFVQAWINRGYALNDLKRYEEALASYDRAIELKPNFSALDIKPDYAEAWSNRGVALNNLKCYEQALASYDRAIEIKPDYALAWSNRGSVLNDLKRYEEALANCDRAIEIRPDYAEAWSNRGNALSDLKRYEEALASYGRAIQIKPDYALAWSNRGYVLNNLKRHEEAIASLERSIELKPNADFVLGELVHTQMKIFDWTNLDQRLQTIEAEIMSGNTVSRPFSVLGLFDKPQLQRQCAAIYAKKELSETSQLGVIAKMAKEARIRIGYFSMDFCEHPISQRMVDLIELHDRTRFEIYGFSFGADTKDPMRQRMEKAFDRFIDVKSHSELEIARLAREHAIDIAIDLGGYTKDSRPQIFAERAAPLQINYFGFPGTLGSECMDYFMGDRVTIPDDYYKYFSEKIIFLPNSFQPNPSQRPIEAKDASRQSHKLPETGFIFCCFNNTWKITPDVFESWIRILKKVEDSILWLSDTHPIAKRNILAAFTANNIHLSRVVFAEKLPSLADHLQRYLKANLFLDTFPYCAHTTASDALWAGLPVLTRSGESFVSRGAASQLSSIGLPELVTNSHHAYESLAIELATNPEKLLALKAKLASNRTTMPLFNTPLLTQHIEAAYRAIYDRYHAGLLPDHIYVDSLIPTD